MDEKAPSSFPDGEPPGITEAAAETTNDDPAPGGGGGAGQDVQAPLAEQIRAGLRWTSLLLVPLLVFVAVAVVLAIRGSDDWPAQPGLERIETRAAYPRVAWTLDDRLIRAIIDVTAAERLAPGAVIFTSNEMQFVPGYPRAGLALQAGPTFESETPRAIWPLIEPVLDGGGNFLLRLGDAAYGGISKASLDKFFPGSAYKLFGSEVHFFYATVYGPNLVFQDALGRSALTTPALVTNAATVALLKADRRQLNRLYLVQRTEQPLGAGPFLPPQQWIEAIVAAIDSTAPYLRSINEVYLVASPRRFNLTQKSLENIPPVDMAKIKAALDLPSPSFPSRVAANLVKIFSVSLPWPDAAEILPLRALPGGTALILPGKDDAPGTLNPAAINPIYRSAGRGSFLPAAAFFLCFGFVLVWSLRREQPGPPNLTEIAQGGLVALALTFVTLRILQYYSGEWLYGVDLTGIADLDAAGVLGGASLAAGLGGLLTGRVSFRAARLQSKPAHREPTPSEPPSRLRAVLFRDVPVQDRAGDHLGFGTLVDALASFLDNRRTEPPLVLAVNGPWGAGKSSIMLMLGNKLEATGRFRIAWFNAWKYQKQEQILAAFLKTVADQLSKGWGIWFSLRLAWIRIKDATFFELCTLSAPFVLLFIAYFAPDLLTALGLVAAGAAKNPEGQIAGLAPATQVVGGGGLVMLLWLARFFLPFRVSYRKLFSMRDVGQHIGFLDQFEREFRLYRQVVDREKLLIVIDDLDRCHPDAVVEVLKTINLIVTSDTGKGKTFFVLGFDPRFIIRSIEHHFKEFAKLGNVVDGRFGPQYLKKIVTIAVSVPKPDEEALKDLVKNLSKAGTAESSDSKGTQKLTSRADWKKRIGEWSTLIRKGLRRPVSAFAAGLVIVAALVLWSGDRADRGQDAPLKPAEAGAAVSATAAVARATTGGIVVGPPDLTGRGGRPVLDFVEPVVTGLALVAALMVLVRVFGTAVAVRQAPREPDDSEEFVEAVLELEARMPQNPRDLVRVVNRMRMAYLIQAKPEIPPSDYKDPFTGDPLEASDSALLTLLQQQHPNLFDPDLLDVLTAGEDSATIDVSHALDKLEKEKDPLAKLATDFKKLMADDSAAKAVLGDRAKLKRFLAVNRFLLQRYELTPEEEKQADSEDGSKDSGDAHKSDGK